MDGQESTGAEEVDGTDGTSNHDHSAASCDSGAKDGGITAADNGNNNDLHDVILALGSLHSGLATAMSQPDRTLPLQSNNEAKEEACTTTADEVTGKVMDESSEMASPMPPNYCEKEADCDEAPDDCTKPAPDTSASSTTPPRGTLYSNGALTPQSDHCVLEDMQQKCDEPDLPASAATPQNNNESEVSHNNIEPMCNDTVNTMVSEFEPLTKRKNEKVFKTEMPDDDGEEVQNLPVISSSSTHPREKILHPNGEVPSSSFAHSMADENVVTVMPQDDNDSESPTINIDSMPQSNEEAAGDTSESNNSDAKGNNDVILSVKNAEYKSILGNLFAKIGLNNTREEYEKATEETFQMFKQRGGKFFTVNRHNVLSEMNEQQAYEKIKRNIIQDRKRYYAETIESSGKISKTSEKSNISVAKYPYAKGNNDVILSVKNDEYKSILGNIFKKLGLSNTREEYEKATEEIFQMFKQRGGKFFKMNEQDVLVEMNERQLYNKLKRDIIHDRITLSKHWPNAETIEWSGKISEKSEQSVAEYPSANNVQNDTITRQTRKRTRTKNFMDAQGQEMLIQEEMRRKSTEAKRKRSKRNGNHQPDPSDRPFSRNEIRQFEQGCIRHGWGEWEEVVKKWLPYRTLEECMRYAATVEEKYPDLKESIINDHEHFWVKDGEQSLARKHSQQKVAAKPRRADERGESSMRVCQMTESMMTTDGASDTSKFSNEVTNNKSKRNRSEQGCNLHQFIPAKPGVDENVRRPKRQSAMNARNRIQLAVKSENEVIVENESDASSVNIHQSKLPAKSKLKGLKKELFKGLSDNPLDGKFYEEESAWRFHNPPFPMGSVEQLTPVRQDIVSHMAAPTRPEELQPLPPPNDLPPLPSTGFCTWSFDPKSRVLLANFRDCPYYTKKRKIKFTKIDEEFLVWMMEKDDITVVSEGLADAINPSLWTREYIEGCIGSEYHHKIRVFETISKECGNGIKGIEQQKEKHGWYSMRVSDYFQYLEHRQSVKNEKLDKGHVHELNENFSFTDSYGEKKSVNVDKEALYMIDVDLVKLLPQAFQDFQQNFDLPGILPGGSHCMMNAVNANGRPFMGPNLYITPPSTFTHFHQDGHGTVDSGHLCLSGFNEVVMLRRLTERHKCNAIQILTGTADSFGTLYGLPHQDGSDERKLGWPSEEAIFQCKKMGYCPSVFILKPGQVVHINKGRLHAFRKLAPSQLRETDCHYDLRNEILQTKGKLTEDICFSVAWDWMFKGFTEDGINKEVSSTIECARLNREHHLQSLAIPETSLLFLAKESIAKHQLETKIRASTKSLFGMEIPQRQSINERCKTPADVVLRGILPSLQYVVHRHNSAEKFSEAWEEKTKDVKNSWRVSIDPKPNTWQDPGSFALDPYGSGDFFCKFCAEELSNVYMHCDGCEKLLDKDFNICSTCHMNGKYKAFVQMHPFNPKSQSILNHTGHKTLLRQARCPCKNGKECGYCSYCTGCSCRCHQWFTLHYRFMNSKEEGLLLQQAESIVGSEIGPKGLETKARLFSLMPGDLPQEFMLNNNGICQVIGEARSEDGNNESVVLPQIPTEACQAEEGTKKKRKRPGIKKDKTKSALENGEKDLRMASAKKKEVARDTEGKSAKEKRFKEDGGGKKLTTIRRVGAENEKIEMDLSRNRPGIKKDKNANDKTTPAKGVVTNEPNVIAKEKARKDRKRPAKQQTATFICPVCSKEFVFTCVKTAGEKFQTHLDHCKKSTARRSSSNQDMSKISDSSENRTHENDDDIPSGTERFDPNELKAGNRVIVLKNGLRWQATIIKCHEKKGKPGFRIHFDGSKKSRFEWFPPSSIVDIMDDISEDY